LEKKKSIKPNKKVILMTYTFFEFFFRFLIYILVKKGLEALSSIVWTNCSWKKEKNNLPPQKQTLA